MTPALDIVPGLSLQLLVDSRISWLGRANPLKTVRCHPLFFLLWPKAQGPGWEKENSRVWRENSGDKSGNRFKTMFSDGLSFV